MSRPIDEIYLRLRFLSPSKSRIRTLRGRKVPVAKAKWCGAQYARQGLTQQIARAAFENSGKGTAMQRNLISKALPAALAIAGLGFSAVALAAGGAGTSGSTGGFVGSYESFSSVLSGPTAPVAQIQDASGRGAHNFVDDEGHRVNRTWVNDAQTQLASGIGARNYVERDADRFDTLRADRGDATPFAAQK
jgi:hypothetical protein